MSEAPAFQNGPVDRIDPPAARFLPNQLLAQPVNGDASPEQYRHQDYKFHRERDGRRIEDLIAPVTSTRDYLDILDERSRMAAGEACAAATEFDDFADVLEKCAEQLRNNAHSLRLGSSDITTMSKKLSAGVQEYFDARSAVIEVTQTSWYERDELAAVQTTQDEQLRQTGRRMAGANTISKQLNAEDTTLRTTEDEHRAVVDDTNKRIAEKTRAAKDDLMIQFQIADQTGDNEAALAAINALQEMQYDYGQTYHNDENGDATIARDAASALAGIQLKRQRNKEQRRRHVEIEEALQQEMGQLALQSRQTSTDMKHVTDKLDHQLNTAETGLNLSDAAATKTLTSFESGSIAGLEHDIDKQSPIREVFPGMLKTLRQLLMAAGGIAPTEIIELPDLQRGLPRIITKMQQEPTTIDTPNNEPQIEPSVSPKSAAIRIVSSTPELTKNSKVFVINRNAVERHD